MYTLYASILATLGLVLSAASEPANNVSSDWIAYLLQGGPFAVVVILFVFEKLITPGERDRLREENAQYKKDIATLNESMRNDIIPLLSQNNETMKKVYDELTYYEKHRREGG